MPPEKTGQGFSFYSAFILLPYAFVPFTRSVVGYESLEPAYWYAGMTLLLLPLLVLPSILQLKKGTQASQKSPAQATSKKEILHNVLRRPILILLSTQTLYFISFSALFFLLKDYALSLGIKDVGPFFTIQMLCMVAVRLFAARLFDRVNQKLVIIVSFLVTAAAFLLLFSVQGHIGLYLTAVVFGLGTGTATPPLNSLMYHSSQARFRGMNANFMMLVLHFGMFLGPTLGSFTIAWGNYGVFLGAFAGINATAALLFVFFTSPQSKNAR
jgi:predicted MFS family arabinose efflux permease